MRYEARREEKKNGKQENKIQEVKEEEKKSEKFEMKIMNINPTKHYSTQLSLFNFFFLFCLILLLFSFSLTNNITMNERE
jgi:hypothetical protein